MEHDRLTGLFAQLWPGAVVHAARDLTGGVSSLMTRVEVVSPDLPSSVIVRRMGAATRLWDPGSLAREARVLDVARRAGIPAPPLLAHDLEGAILGEPLLVLGYLEGEVATDVRQPLAYARELADVMASVHRLDPDAAGLEPARVTPAPEPPEPGFDTLARAYDVLARQPPPTDAPVFLHGDLWPGNTLVRHGQLTGVIDWEEARRGDALCDIAIARLDLLWLYGWPATEAFTAQMAEHRPLPLRDLAYADLFAALRPGTHLALWAEVYPDLGRPDVTLDLMRERQLELARRALEVLG